MKKLFLLCSALLSFLLSADSVTFLSKPMSVGKALLAENGYSFFRTLDTADFSPELKLPVQLVYNSSVEKSGLFGFAWRSPQLESTAYYDKDGVLWITPRGEKIKFFPKRDVTINLTCRFYDDIDWKSYEELVVDHDGSFANWGVTSYIEGALDVWLDHGLKSNYEIDVSWNKLFNKHFAA